MLSFVFCYAECQLTESRIFNLMLGAPFFTVFIVMLSIVMLKVVFFCYIDFLTLFLNYSWAQCYKTFLSVIYEYL